MTKEEILKYVEEACQKAYRTGFMDGFQYAHRNVKFYMEEMEARIIVPEMKKSCKN